MELTFRETKFKYEDGKLFNTDYSHFNSYTL